MSFCAWNGFGISTLLAGWMVVTCGCGSGLSNVSGSVTVDGKPLEKGVISYVPADSQGTPATAEVVRGKYDLQVHAGKKFVQISAPVVIGKKKEYDGPDAPYIEFSDESLPSKYNSETTLSFEVKPGSNAKDWAVESQPPK